MVPMALYVLPLSPNDHPTTSQVSLGTAKGHRKCICHPTHVGGLEEQEDVDEEDQDDFIRKQAHPQIKFPVI